MHRGPGGALAPNGMLFVKQFENYKIMKNKIIVFSVSLLLLVITAFSSGSATTPEIKKTKKITAITVKDTTETNAEAAEPAEPELTLYKKDVFATYYADKFNGRKTSSGERFHNNNYTAAHMKLPFGTKLRVTNEKTGKFVDVKVNDRGPFTRNRIIDLAKGPAQELGLTSTGTAYVSLHRVE